MLILQRYVFSPQNHYPGLTFLHLFNLYLGFFSGLFLIFGNREFQIGLVVVINLKFPVGNI